ncbi:MAG TPA: pyridoxal-phosphate dependent enzyme, partial [Thermomicrobiales bacterium]|nr:pyridoxal-phosphate dependent enzyme [Thermomicrobiales bacterium]
MAQTAEEQRRGLALRGEALPAIDPISGLPLPTLHDVLLARQGVARYLTPTPLLRPAALAERLGCDVYVKCENLQPIGAFKVRGGLNLLSHLSPEQRARGVIAASTGNHGQSIAYAAREFGCEARIYLPERANPLKVASMERLGARVVYAGVDFDEALGVAERDAAASGAHFIHSANEPLLIAGVATCALEILEAVPDLDVLIVPGGGGSGLAGACLVGKGINSALRVIGVQAEGAPAMWETWRAGAFVTTERVDTYAEGLATRVAWSLPMQILWRRLDDFLLVGDAEMRRATLTLLETTRQLAEGAGAAAAAAAWRL